MKWNSNLESQIYWKVLPRKKTLWIFQETMGDQIRGERTEDGNGDCNEDNIGDVNGVQEVLGGNNEGVMG